MVQSKKNSLAAAGAFLLGGVLAAVSGAPSAGRLTGPLVRFGTFLRGLSLGSAAGNAQAWAIVLALSCLPLLGLLWKKRSKADLLLLLGSAEIFAMLYYLVNPTLVSQLPGWPDANTMAGAWGLIAAGCTAGTLLCWALLRLLDLLRRKPAAILPAFLFWTAVLYAFLLAFSGVRGLEAAVAELAQGNTPGPLLAGSRSMLILLHTLALLPDLLGVGAILLAGRLTLQLEKEPFAEETVALAETISRKTVFLARLSLLLTVLGGALQMAFFSRLLRVQVEIHIPLLTLALCAVLLLLCRYFRRAKAVNDDNASII